MSVSVPQRIGMLGGAFDPPHCAHRALAEAALDQLQLDRLHIMPTGHAWHKSRALSPAAHRIAMCQAAFGDLDRVVIDTRETERPGPTYTADTLQALAQQYPDARLYVVLGADQLRAFHTWRHWQAVLQQATLAVARRPMDGTDTDLDTLGIPFQPIDMPLHRLSSTDIRARWHPLHARSGHSTLDALVPVGVARYISQHHLYETST